MCVKVAYVNFNNKRMMMPRNDNKEYISLLMTTAACLMFFQSVLDLVLSGTCIQRLLATFSFNVYKRFFSIHVTFLRLSRFIIL